MNQAAQGGTAASSSAHSGLVEIEVIGSALGAYPGAEIVGIVRGAGESAQHLIGAPVVAPRLLPCGECDACRRGRLAGCPSLVSRPTRPEGRETLPARFLMPLQPPFLAAAPPAEALYRYAALGDALLGPYSGLVRAGVTPGALCLVLGGGARAAMAVMAARAIGASVAVLCPLADEREALLAPPYRAVAALDPTALDAGAIRAALADVCREGGIAAPGLCILETSGSDAGRARALSLLDPGGTAVLLGRVQPDDRGAASGPGLPAALDAGPGLGGLALLDGVVAGGGQLIGAGPPHPDLLPELLALVERAQVELDLGLLTRPIAPSQIEATLALRRQSGGSAQERLALPVVVYPAGGAAGEGTSG